jgi:hypothetical protein
MSLRRAVIVLLSGAALQITGIALLWPPAVASARPDQGSISVQQGDQLSPPSNVGLLSVTLAAPSNITSLTVSLFDVCGGTDKLDLPMTDFTVPVNQGDGYYHAWTLMNPITTGQLTIGSYCVL